MFMWSFGALKKGHRLDIPMNEVSDEADITWAMAYLHWHPLRVDLDHFLTLTKL